jgi:hypothetical protein
MTSKMIQPCKLRTFASRRVRLDRRATAISLLVVIGARADGRKVLLAVRSMGSESTEAWRMPSGMHPVSKNQTEMTLDPRKIMQTAGYAAFKVEAVGGGSKLKPGREVRPLERYGRR